MSQYFFIPFLITKLIFCESVKIIPYFVHLNCQVSINNETQTIINLGLGY